MYMEILWTLFRKYIFLLKLSVNMMDSHGKTDESVFPSSVRNNIRNIRAAYDNSVIKQFGQTVWNTSVNKKYRSLRRENTVTEFLATLTRSGFHSVHTKIAMTFHHHK